MFALPAMAGEPTLVFTPPAPAPTPAPSACPFSVELGATYRFATKEMINYGPAKDIDVYGPEITGVYELTPEHAVTLRFGYNYGSEAFRYWGATETVRVNSFYLMPGYRYTADLDDSWSLFAGISAGVTNMSNKYRGWFGENEVIKAHASDWAAVGTIELGVQYHVTDSTYLYAAYELYGNLAEPRVIPDAGGDTQVYHSIRVGLGIDF